MSSMFCWLSSLQVSNNPLSLMFFPSCYTSDDEKFLFKHELKPEQTHNFALANVRDIIAVRFKLKKMFIFSDYDYVGGTFYKNVSKILCQITLSQARATFGFNDLCVLPLPPPLLSSLPLFICAVTTLERYTLAPFRLHHHFPTPSHRSSAPSPTFLALSHV
jgi:hypothetical protein